MTESAAAASVRPLSLLAQFDSCNKLVRSLRLFSLHLAQVLSVATANSPTILNLSPFTRAPSHLQLPVGAHQIENGHDWLGLLGACHRPPEQPVVQKADACIRSLTERSCLVETKLLCYSLQGSPLDQLEPCLFQLQKAVPQPDLCFM